MAIPGFRITWTSKDATVSPDGELGYMFSNQVVTLNDPEGTPMTVESRVITIWRRDPDGEWRCVVDIWHDAPTVEPTT